MTIELRGKQRRGEKIEEEKKKDKKKSKTKGEKKERRKKHPKWHADANHVDESWKLLLLLLAPQKNRVVPD